MTALSVRAADAPDAAAISGVGSAAFHDAYDGTAESGSIARHVESYFGEAAVSRELANDSVAYLVGFSGDRCAGFIKLRESPAPEAVPGSRPLEVQQLYVDPARQRSGIGGRLVEAAVRRARDRDHDGLWLSVWSEAGWATSFYRRAGFVTLGTIPFRLDETEYVDFLMWLPLGEDSRGGQSG